MKHSEPFEAIEELICQLSDNFPPLSFKVLWNTNDHTARLIFNFDSINGIMYDAEFPLSVEGCQAVLDSVCDIYLPW